MPTPVGAIVSGGVGIASGIIGDELAASDIRRADKKRREAEKIWSNMEGIDPKDLVYDASQEDYVGDVVTPDMYVPETALNELEGITTNPSLAIAQQESMNAYNDIIAGGGLTDMDRLNAERAMQASAQQATMQSDDIQQDMARRGMSGSGNELLAKLVGSQGAVNRLSDQQQDLQAVAQQRALDAISRKGGLATQFRDQEFGEKSEIATAGNEINKFNIDGATKSALSNQELQVKVGQGNQNTGQSVERGNTVANNKASSDNVGNLLDGKEQDIKIGTGQSQSLLGASAYANRKAENTKKKVAAIGDVVGGVASLAI